MTFLHFAYSLSWWLDALVALFVCLAAFLPYRRPLAPLMAVQRGALIACRALVLAIAALILFRPIALITPADARGAVVPILIDVSRSMRVHDAEGARARLAQAVSIVRAELLPSMTGLRPEIYTIGDRIEPSKPDALDQLKADARQSDLAGAIAQLRERYRGESVAGVIVLSDGADTGQRQLSMERGPAAAPVFAIGLGSPDGVPDREVVSIAAGDPGLDQSSVDLHVSAVSRGLGRKPFDLRVLANGRLLETRRIAPVDGAVVDETFTIFPDSTTPTVYTAEIPEQQDDSIAENNTRSVLIKPAGRKRRLLIVEGAPGFEHSFLTRALARDGSLEADSIVRKGKNSEGRDTFFVQAGGGRAPALVGGVPSRREDLFAYDAIVLANVEADFFSRSQLATLADFVAERGGGLLVLGGRALTSRTLIGSPLEEALPVELNDRRGAALPAFAAGGRPEANKLLVTADGENHPVMRVASSRDESLKRWAALPTLAASAPLGEPRPGATVLAVTTAPGGGVYPVVAVQPYGRGRSMIFAGEASWRWKMLAASSDRTHEFFWRQAARWLTRESPDPVTVNVPDASEPGDSISMQIDARDPAFAPASDATIEATLKTPDGAERQLKVRSLAATKGRFAADAVVDRAGMYRVRVAARRGTSTLGEADAWLSAGGNDREFADPRLNEGWLRRIARASGGRYVRAADAGRIVPDLKTGATPAALEPRDLWHTPWTLGVLLVTMSVEWTLRRRWGLR